MGFGVRGLASPHPFLGAMVGMDQKDRCSGLFQAGFVGYCAPRAVFFRVFLHLALCARGVQENWIIWEMACILLRLLVSGSHLFELFA